MKREHFLSASHPPIAEVGTVLYFNFPFAFVVFGQLEEHSEACMFTPLIIRWLCAFSRKYHDNLQTEMREHDRRGMSVTQVCGPYGNFTSLRRLRRKVSPCSVGHIQSYSAVTPNQPHFQWQTVLIFHLTCHHSPCQIQT